MTSRTPEGPGSGNARNLPSKKVYSLPGVLDFPKMLSTVRTIEMARDLKDLTLTALDWARRKGASEEIMVEGRKMLLLAERKLGEMLKTTERAKGTRGQLRGRDASGGATVLPPEDSVHTLASLGITKRDSAEAQKLAALDEKEFDRLVETKSKQAHVSRNTGRIEWFTPARITDMARTVLGAIDLDPASCAEANETVQASRFFTKQDDGLMQDWRGLVWMNPPYSATLIGRFCVKLIASYNNGAVSGAVVLVNNATETKWFQALLRACTRFCLPTGRIAFWRTGEPAFTPLQGQALFYFGPKADRFADVFQSLGPICDVVRSRE